jgi:hypothetical protein
LTDTKVATRNFDGTSCQLDIEEFTFEGYNAESDWQAPLIASFSGRFNAESTCTSIVATLAVLDEYGVVMNSTVLTNLAKNGTQFEFDMSMVEVVNS